MNSVFLLRSKFMLRLIVGVTMGTLAQTTFAVGEEKCYSLRHGKKLQLCRDFTANLNMFCDGQPLACSRKIHPKFSKDFAFPKWQSLDPRANLNIIAEAFRSFAYQWYPVRQCEGLIQEQAEECSAAGSEKLWQERRPEVMARIEAGTFKLWRARFDLNRDGKKETVFLLTAGPQCEADDPSQYAWPGRLAMMVLDEQSGHFNREYVGGLTFGSWEEPIYYKGLIYLLSWNRTSRGINIGEVGSGPGIGEFASLGIICSIRYKR